MKLMNLREERLDFINKTVSYSLPTAYLSFVGLWYYFKGVTPYFWQVMRHGIFATVGFLLGGLIAEKIAAELFYNQVLFSLADKYNFTP